MKMKMNEKIRVSSLVLMGIVLILSISCKKTEDNTIPKPTPTPTPTPTTVTDIDGNVYTTVTIGTQVWLKQNLKVNHFRNGDSIPNIVNATTWNNNTTVAACCDFANLPDNSMVYGKLYNFNAVTDNRKIAPLGWHVSTDAEWSTLKSYLGGDDIAGGKLKETGTLHWSSPNTGATNSSGFTALPGGYREMDGAFDNSSMQRVGIYWSSTVYNANNAWYLTINYDAPLVGRDNGSKKRAYSIRCVKD